MRDADIRLTAAEYSYKPVQSIGCDFIEFASATAGRGGWREGVSNFLCDIGRQRMKVIGPVLQLILPEANEFPSRLPIPLIEHFRGEPVPKCSASLGGNARLMEEDKQQALMQVGYVWTSFAKANWMNFLHQSLPGWHSLRLTPGAPLSIDLDQWISSGVHRLGHGNGPDATLKGGNP